MSAPIITVENLSKRYRLGQIGATSLRESVERGWHRLRGGRGEHSINHLPSTIHHPSHSDDIWALRDISFEVKRGEVLGIIGKNGAGKSTLLKILSRITEPTSGRAILRGRVGSLLEVGTGFHPELTGRENIYLNGAILGMKKAEITNKLDEIIAFAEVEKFVDTPVKRYSSGMYVRLAFAVAAHLDPEILLVDEVLAVGDVAFQKKCMGKMDDVAHAGRTVLFVSHNMFNVQKLCTRGILLGSGRIASVGRIGSVVDFYLNSGEQDTGEVTWESPEVAPGASRVRLKAVRVVSDNAVTAVVDISKALRIEVDYWNLEKNGRRLVSVHLHSSAGVCILTSSNAPSLSIKPDSWYSRPYPAGVFRTSCVIPGCFLNDGVHSISVFINGSMIDNILSARDVLTFSVQDIGTMRAEYSGKWLGAVRPRLEWKTTQLDAR